MKTSQTALVVLALALAAASACLAAPAPAPVGSFQTWFAGEWEVVQTAFPGGLEQEAAAAGTVGHYVVERENGTDSLVGSSYDNDTATGEVSNQLAMRVTFAEGSSSRGVFLTGEDLEGELAALFEFHFVEHANGMHVSRGEWKAGGSYVFVASSADTFLITVAGSPDGDFMFTGKRVVHEAEKTFFQKHGSMIMLGGFFIFNTFLQKKARGGQQAAGAAAAGAPVTESASAPAESKKDD